MIFPGRGGGDRTPIHRGKVVTSFVIGSQELYRWIHDNPVVEMHSCDYTNDPFVIAQHDRFVAVNSAIQVDLTGQVVSDSIGRRFYSGIEQRRRIHVEPASGTRTPDHPPAGRLSAWLHRWPDGRPLTDAGAPL